MPLYFSATLLVLLFAAACAGPLSWDGSYYLFKILDTGTPFLNNRLSNAPLHWIVLFVASWTSDLRTLQTAFGAMYASLPFLALATSWWIVRRCAKQLFIWPALGIGLATLPGQFAFVNEATIVVQLFWPLLLAAMTGIRRSGFVFAVLTAFVFFAHPVMIMLFAVGAGLLSLMAIRFPSRRHHLWPGALTLAGVALLRVLMFWVSAPSGEIALAQSGREIWLHLFRSVLSGSVLAAIGCTWLAGLLIFMVDRLPHRESFRRLRRAGHWAAGTTVAAGGTVLALWARDPALWIHAHDFRFLVPLSSLPLMALAIFEHRGGSDTIDRGDGDWSHRVKIAQVTGLAFMVVLAIQSSVWFDLTLRLRDTITQTPERCLSTSAIPWLASTPFSTWPTPTYAIIVQGRRPRKLVLEGDHCSDTNFQTEIRLTPWEVRSRTGGWFDLRVAGL